MNADVWCWRKACGSFDEIPSVTMGTCKRKFLMNSNTTLTVLNLHQQTDPKVQQDFKGHYSKVKSQRSNHVAHLHPLTNVPTMYQLPTPYGFQDIARTRFYRSSSLRQGQRSNHRVKSPTPSPTQPMSLPSMNFLHLTVSEIQPRQTISRHLPTRPPARPSGHHG